MPWGTGLRQAQPERVRGGWGLSHLDVHVSVGTLSPRASKKCSARGGQANFTSAPSATSDLPSARTVIRSLPTWQRSTIDHLVNNAGHGDYAAFAETSEAQFDRLVNVHFKGVFFLTQALLPLIADGGRIVNFSTGLTRLSLPGYAAYAAAKGAVEVLTRYLAKELGARGIAVNTVAPGAIETDFGGGVVRDNPALNQQLAQMTALGRVGVPDDIGPMVASLLDASNRWVTAQRIEVSGGQAL